MSTGALFNKKSSPRVSIGMPVYNGEKFLEKGLTFLLNQTFTDFELIISDNASTDRTEEICRNYAQKDPRIRYLRQSQNQGVFPNYEIVLHEARAEYFMWAACDDWWSPSFIGELVPILDANPDVVLAFCEHQHVDMNGVPFENYVQLKKVAASDADKSRLSCRNSFEKYISKYWTSGGVNLLYGLIRRKELLLADVMRRWGKFGWGDDVLMAAAILRYGNVKFSNQVLWKKTLYQLSAGSAIPREAPPTIFDSLIGVVSTLRKYLRFSLGIWLVQGAMPETKNIQLLRRMYFTSFVLVSMLSTYTNQLVRAIFNRVRLAAKKGEK